MELSESSDSEKNAENNSASPNTEQKLILAHKEGTPCNGTASDSSGKDGIAASAPQKSSEQSPSEPPLKKQKRSTNGDADTCEKQNRSDNEDVENCESTPQTTAENGSFSGIVPPAYLLERSKVAHQLGCDLARVLIARGADAMLATAKLQNTTQAPNTKPKSASDDNTE